jgi:lysophospholipase L1-like esterase
VTGVLAQTTPAVLAKSGPIRIMALGDSITAGVGANGSGADFGGYRGALGALLAQGGYRAVFVGSRSDYSARILNRAHEGWPGYVLRSFPADPGPGQLYGTLIHDALHRNAPDVVLLMAGTNDLLRLEKHVPGYTLANIVQSMNMVIEQIVTEKPHVFVIVAPVVLSPRVDTCTLRDFDGDDPCTGTAGGGVRALVDGFAQRGFHVVFAPAMANAVPRDHDHFPDGIHPSGDDGYVAIANIWYSAIERLTQPAQSDVATDGDASALNKAR